MYAEEKHSFVKVLFDVIYVQFGLILSDTGNLEHEESVCVIWCSSVGPIERLF